MRWRVFFLRVCSLPAKAAAAFRVGKCPGLFPDGAFTDPLLSQLCSGSPSANTAGFGGILARAGRFAFFSGGAFGVIAWPLGWGWNGERVESYGGPWRPAVEFWRCGAKGVLPVFW
ncbi:hypothetical protein DQ04_08251050, partial [Trypanosoma grayi]|uniref:hypothetical protein n=1 Tax=Trypanosoma grayi TaxID=71804 RepID=UPI0004F45BB0